MASLPIKHGCPASKSFPFVSVAEQREPLATAFTCTSPQLLASCFPFSWSASVSFSLMTGHRVSLPSESSSLSTQTLPSKTFVSWVMPLLTTSATQICLVIWPLVPIACASSMSPVGVPVSLGTGVLPSVAGTTGFSPGIAVTSPEPGISLDICKPSLTISDNDSSLRARLATERTSASGCSTVFVEADILDTSCTVDMTDFSLEKDDMTSDETGVKLSAAGTTVNSPTEGTALSGTELTGTLSDGVMIMSESHVTSSTMGGISFDISFEIHVISAEQGTFSLQEADAVFTECTLSPEAGTTLIAAEHASTDWQAPRDNCPPSATAPKVDSTSATSVMTSPIATVK